VSTANGVWERIMATTPMASRDTLIRLGSEVHLDGDNQLLREGEDTGSLWLIVEGRIRLWQRMPDRTPITLAILDVGEAVGWSALLPPYKAQAGATAVGSVDLLAFPAVELRAALDQDPVLGMAVYREVLGVIAGRFEASHRLLSDLYGVDTFEPL
jgi:CRP-like cAMP-binding protein